MSVSVEDTKFAKKMAKLEWALVKNILMPAGYSSRDEQILEAVACEFAQKCVLDLIGRLKPELSRMKSGSRSISEESAADEESKAKNAVCFNDTYRLNLARQLRRSVMILGAGWKASESLHITFIEVQGMSLRKVIDHLVRSKANWEDVGQIMLLPDAMWSWRGNVASLTDLVTIMRQRAPNATIYLCGIPIYDSNKIEAWQLHWIKLFNQYVFKLCSASPGQTVQVFYMGKFVKEHKNDWQPSKPYYPKPEVAGTIVASLVKVFEHLAEKRLGVNVSTAPPMISEQ